MIGHTEITEPLLKYQRELEALGDSDDSTQNSTFRRARDEYREALEAVAGACICGGAFSFSAPPRCPACRSTNIELGRVLRMYD